MECYYENDDPRFANIDKSKGENLPLLPYFNILRHLDLLIRHDNRPRQRIKEIYHALLPNDTPFVVDGFMLEDPFDKLRKQADNQSSFNYQTSNECELVLIWGGLAAMILNPTSWTIHKRTLYSTVQEYIKDSSYYKSCFEPFMSIRQRRMSPQERYKPQVSKESLTKEPVAKAPLTCASDAEKLLNKVSVANKPVAKNMLPHYIELDSLLQQASQDHYNNPTFLQLLKALLCRTVNKLSGGDPHVQNHLQAGLTLLDAQVQMKKEEQKKRTPTHKFSDLILHKEPEKLLERLHQLIDGKRGAAVGAVLMRAQQKGYLIKVPTQAEFESAFTLIGGWNAIQNYMNDNSTKALAKANKIIIFEDE